MLYDAGDECTDVTGGWSYSQTPGAHNASYVGRGQWRTVNNFDVSDYDLCVVNRYSHYISGSAGMNHTCYGLSQNYLTENGKNDFAGFISGDISDIKTSVGGFMQVWENTYYPTINRSTRGANYLYIYHKYDTYCESEAYLYHLFLVKNDFWQTWLIKAGLNVSGYDSLDAVIADNTALSTLMSSKAAVNYMLYHCTGTVMAAVIRSHAALEAIADSCYNAQIFKNKHWDKFLRIGGAVPETEKTYLYRNGEETIGFSVGYSYGVRPASPKLTKTDNCVIYTTYGDSVGGSYLSLASDNPYNTSGAKKLKCATRTDTGNVVPALSLVSNRSAYWGDVVIATTPSLEGIAELDISNITDSYYIAVSVKSNKPDGMQTRLYKIWLE